jgi:hexulose-6-phosphate isomerase
MIDFLQQVNSPFVGAYWDMGNAVSMGYDPEQEVKLLGSHIVQVHIKEFAGIPSLEYAGYSSGINSVPLGEGQVPLAGILRALADIQYREWLVLETGIYGEGIEAIHSSAASSLATVRVTLANLPFS